MHFYLVLDPQVTFTVTLNKCKRHRLLIPDISLVTQVKPAEDCLCNLEYLSIQIIESEISSVAHDILNDTYDTQSCKTENQNSPYVVQVSISPNFISLSYTPIFTSIVQSTVKCIPYCEWQSIKSESYWSEENPFQTIQQL